MLMLACKSYSPSQLLMLIESDVDAGSERSGLGRAGCLDMAPVVAVLEQQHNQQSKVKQES